MSITNLTHTLNLSNNTNYYLNMPSNPGMSSGYWFYYSSSISNNVQGTKIVPYRWGERLVTNEGFTLTMEGSIPLVSESLNRQRIFHGSTITRIGAGINDITLTPEEDAFMFYHMGSLAASDSPGYWDRGFKSSVASGDWEYYQYHLHSPNVYADFDQARVANGAQTWINSSDKEYGYLQPIQVSSMGTDYLNILARVHRPSVGGAHNSHYDIELNSSTTKNYAIGGIIPGLSNRFHAFYTAQNGSQWDVFSRTYVLTNGSFTAEVNHGAYNLAPPTMSIASRNYSRFPIRASAGAVISPNVYIPLIYSGSGATFDVKIWGFPSADSISTGDINVTTVVTSSVYRPDCHLTVANGELNAVVSYNNALSGSSASGSVQYFKYSGSQWVNQGTLLTNGPQEVIRIHGFEYNTQDNLFYTLLSGNVTGSGGTYTGPGIYSFSDGAVFTGYKHMSYITSSYGFQLKDALEPGYITYTNLDGALTFNTGTEPQGISEDFYVLKYDTASPEFFEQKEAILGGKEYFYAGTRLQDGRVVLVGNIEDNPGNTGDKHDLLMAIYPEGFGNPEFYAYSGTGDDYFTGVVEDTQRKCLWMTGYTRSELAQKRDIWVHGYGRALIDGGNFLEWKDLVVDYTGSQYMTGKHQQNDSIITAKYDANFNLLWQRNIAHDTYIGNSGNGIAIDSDLNSYIVGESDNKGFVIKLDQTGSTVFSNAYTSSGNMYASSIANVTKLSSEYFVVPFVSASSTIIAVLDTTGSIVEQNILSNFVVNRVRKSDHEPGYFLLAGNDSGSPKKAKFAKGEVLSSGDMIKWIYTYSSGSNITDAFDIRNTEEATMQMSGSTSGSKYDIVGKDNTNAFITKIVIDEEFDNYYPQKLWGKTLVSSSFTSLIYSEQEIENKLGDFHGIISYAVGYSSASAEGEGMNEGILCAFDPNGTRIWTNTLGHMGDEELFAVENDVLNRNIITAGWSESHTNGRRTFSFRADAKGFGTANHFLQETPGMPIYYKSSSLSVINNQGNLTTISTPIDVVGSLVSSSETYNNTVGAYGQEIYDGAVTWNMFVAKLDLDILQTHRNTEAYKLNNEGCDTKVEYVDNFFTFYQAGTAGDGTADDGNFFGYDILLMSESNNVFIAGQTSGHIQFENPDSQSGAYDYILTIFDPNTEEFEFYQSGSINDEEIYAATELSDNNNSIAFVGRSIGTFATSSFGGYDIFLGIYDPTTDERKYFSFGSILNDRGVNVHDLGNNELCIVYETANSATPDQTNAGGFDVAVIKFNYNNWQNGGGTWATSSIQFGSAEDEFLSQDGKPSILLPDGRIVVTGRTLGALAQDDESFGAGDLFVSILDLTTGIAERHQIGSAANETGTTVFYLGGGQVGVAGYTDASFEQPENGIYVKFDASLGPKARTS